MDFTITRGAGGEVCGIPHGLAIFSAILRDACLLADIGKGAVAVTVKQPTGRRKLRLQLFQSRPRMCVAIVAVQNIAAILRYVKVGKPVSVVIPTATPIP